MDAVKTLLPFLTFVIGCAFTLFLKRISDRKALRQGSVREISRLTNAWYNQIHEYPAGFNHFTSPENDGPEKNASTNAMYQYVYNRLILPELLLHLAVIRRHSRCAELARKVEQFLDIVTAKDPLPEKDSTGSPSHDVRTRHRAKLWRKLDSRRCRSFDSHGSREMLLKQLDVLVQDVARESGKLTS